MTSRSSYVSTVISEDSIIRNEIKRLIDVLAANNTLPEHTIGTSLGGLRELSWPGVVVCFTYDPRGGNRGVVAICSRIKGGDIKATFKIWIKKENSLFLDYIDKNVFYHISKPLLLEFKDDPPIVVKINDEEDLNIEYDLERIKAEKISLASLLFSRLKVKS